MPPRKKKTAQTTRKPKHIRFLQHVGDDLRAIREVADVSQEAVSDLFGWGRDAMSKVEHGKTNISLFDYLTILDSLREFAPDHPALALADYLRLHGLRPKYAPRYARQRRSVV